MSVSYKIMSKVLAMWINKYYILKQIIHLEQIWLHYRETCPWHPKWSILKYSCQTPMKLIEVLDLNRIKPFVRYKLANRYKWLLVIDYGCMIKQNFATSFLVATQLFILTVLWKAHLEPKKAILLGPCSMTNLLMDYGCALQVFPYHIQFLRKG